MLSRVAESLFWLSRYIERAENLARLVDVNREHLLDSHRQGQSNPADAWRPVLQATCADEAYDALVEDSGTPPDAGRFITLEDRYPDSIRQCIANARENARMVRDQISEEMWLELNAVHLLLQSSEAEELWASDAPELYNRIIDFSLLFQGLTDATIVHDEGWQFMQIGKFLERADKTSRILDILTFWHEPDRYHCSTVLSSCSAFSAFRAEFRGEATLQNVAAFLLSSQAFPRSVRSCLRQVDHALHAVSGVPAGTFSNEAERLTGSLLARINFSGVDEVFSRGLHAYIDELQKHLNEIGQRLYETYVLLPSSLRDVARSNGSQHMWQYNQQQ
ncbi:MAG: alpha-E domain-containing protein [Verrucomicrobia bacterium]|nr:alpha-E domain-containing protein [Verrucomicrobiota bacterium]